MMEQQVVVIGMGEMGSVFARGCLKLGLTVVPIKRGQSLEQAAAELPDPEMVIVAVGEKDIHSVIETLPRQWHPQAVLLQNELLPRDWSGKIADPTVISVWFEKKKGQDSKVVISSPVYGPKASLIQQALGTLDIPVRLIDSQTQLLYELVRKNIYILTTNIAGLETGGTVSELWDNHASLAREVAADILKIQEKLTWETLDLEQYLQGMLEAFEGDPQHKCMGRSAPQRLQRALQQADSFSLDVPALRRIQQQSNR